MKNLQSKLPKSLQMRELTKNEKILLAILGVVLIGWGSYHFIITPQAEKIQAFNEEKIEYEDKIHEINMIIGQEENIDKDLARLEGEKDNMVSGYFPKLDQAQATYLLNDLLTVDEIKIEEIGFDRPSFEEFEDFEVKNMAISVPYEGTYDGVIAMIKSLKNSPRKIVMEGMSMDRDDQGSLRGSLSLRVYGLDDLAEGKEEVIVLHTERRDIMKTPFSAYSSYKDTKPSTGESEELINPYNPDFSLDYDKDNEISFIPDEEVK